MKIRGVEIGIKKVICLFIYYSVARYLPRSNSFFRIGKRVRYILCKQIFKYCGNNVNVERLANFGSGRDIEIGDNSGLGIDCEVPSNLKVGKNVMMGPKCKIYANNHSFERIDIPMIEQGFQSDKSIQTIIEDDVWIGGGVTMTPGRHIKRGSIIGACCLLCKDFPEYSIVGGNPSRLIRSRITNEDSNCI